MRIYYGYDYVKREYTYVESTDQNTQEIIHADEILTKIRLIDPLAYIAGGAPRDWFYGKSASDIDCFLYVDDRLQNYYKTFMLERIGFQEPKILGDDSSEYEMNKDIRMVCRSYYKGKTVDFIFTNQRITNSVFVDRFALSNSQIIFKGIRRKSMFFLKSDKDYAELEPSVKFLKAEKAKEIWKVNPLYADGSKYIRKIAAKFSDYKILEPTFKNKYTLEISNKRYLDLGENIG